MNKCLIIRERNAISIILEIKALDLKQVRNSLEYYSPKCLQNSFTRARDNDLLTIFVIGFIRTSRQSFTSHVGIGSTGQKTLDDLYSDCLISVLKCPHLGYTGLFYE